MQWVLRDVQALCYTLRVHEIEQRKSNAENSTVSARKVFDMGRASGDDVKFWTPKIGDNRVRFILPPMADDQRGWHFFIDESMQIDETVIHRARELFPEPITKSAPAPESESQKPSAPSIQSDHPPLRKIRLVTRQERAE
jgi:hypothetical protein